VSSKSPEEKSMNEKSLSTKPYVFRKEVLVVRRVLTHQEEDLGQVSSDWHFHFSGLNFQYGMGECDNGNLFLFLLTAL
jgi:hypothetical protein